MVKKTRSTAASPFDAAAGLLDSALADHVKASAQQIWLAGLGALAKAQEEGGRAFETLINEGATLQRKTQTVAEEKLGAVSARVHARMTEVGQKVEEVSAKATGQWDRLETIFEQRVAKALAHLDVPQASELRALSAKVEQLSAQLEKLSAIAGKPVREQPVAAAEKPARKPAAKRRTPRV